MVVSIETTLRNPALGFVKLEDTVVVTDAACDAYGDSAQGWNVVSLSGHKPTTDLPTDTTPRRPIPDDVRHATGSPHRSPGDAEQSWLGRLRFISCSRR